MPCLWSIKVALGLDVAISPSLSESQVCCGFEKHGPWTATAAWPECHCAQKTEVGADLTWPRRDLRKSLWSTCTPLSDPSSQVPCSGGQSPNLLSCHPKDSWLPTWGNLYLITSLTLFLRGFIFEKRSHVVQIGLNLLSSREWP